jgi:outer membrane receptor protein involved in Fe transport
MKLKSSILLIFVCAFLLEGACLAQQAPRGNIKGIVLDKKTGEPLPSVNITIKGTYYGAMSDFNGAFTIANINAGTYDIVVSLLGYKTVEFTAFKVAGGQTASLDVRMEETVLSLGQEVVIIGEKPLFNIEETQTRRSVTGDDIRAAAVQSVQDVVGMQTGVVQADNEIHIRGGRTYENAYLLDGVSVQDQLAGSGFGLQLAPGAIQEVEVLTGGYNAEYGQATSGIVNITTKEGATNYSGTLAYKRDHFGFNDQSISNFNTDVTEASLSGPEPITSTLIPGLKEKIPGSLSFFGTFYSNVTDGYTRWAEKIVNGQPVGYELRVPNQLYSSILDSNKFWSPRAANNWSWLGKLTWKLSPTFKISYSYAESRQIDQNTQAIQNTFSYVEPNPGYQYQFRNILDSANTFTQRNIQHSISITHTLNTQTYYELHFSLYTAHVRGDANGKYFTAYNQPKDIVTLPIQYYNLNRDTIGVIPGDGLYDVGNPTQWRDHFMSEYTIKGDLTHNFTEKNKFKTGIEMRFQNLQMVDIVDPWYRSAVSPLGLDDDVYSVSPSLGALYAQDNITLQGMILNVGLRLDYWMPGKYVDSVVALPSDSTNISDQIRQAYYGDTYNFFGRRMKARLSPRLGVSHPVSDNQTLFFSYGHFSKLPRPQFVYSKLASSSSQSPSQTFGNPNLNPETTVSYELGFRNQISESDVLTLTAYYKDVFDYISAQSIRITNPRFSSSSYTVYINQDYSRIRGLEAEYKLRASDWMHGVISASYSIATGKSSDAQEAAYNLQQGLYENIREEPMVFDRPLQVSASLNLTSKKNQPLFGFGRGWLDNYNAYIRVFYESGKRYTQQLFVGNDPTNGRPEYVPDYSNPNNEIGDYWFYIDLNIEKYFDVAIGQLVLALEIQNLLDRRNSQIINPVTGRAYQYGDPTQYPGGSVNDPLYPQLTYPVPAFPYDPSRYLNPRTFRLGLSFRF